MTDHTYRRIDYIIKHIRSNTYIAKGDILISHSDGLYLTIFPDKAISLSSERKARLTLKSYLWGGEYRGGIADYTIDKLSVMYI